MVVKESKKLYVLIIYCVVALIGKSVLCQTVNQLTKTLDSLKIQKEILQKSLNDINREISKVNRSLIKYYEQEKLQDGLSIYTKYKTSLYEERGTWTKELAEIPPRTALITYELKDNYYLVHYDTLIGFILGLDVESYEEHQNRVKKAEKEKLQQQKRELEIINRYGTEVGRKLLDGYYWLGMTDKMARISLGTPTDINKTVGSWGVHEQWIYEKYHLYLYFEDGILTSYQN